MTIHFPRACCVALVASAACGNTPSSSMSDATTNGGGDAPGSMHDAHVGTTHDAGNGSGSAVGYTTTFDTAETPISEGGAWVHLGADWTTVDTASGNAFGTQTGNGYFDDSYAHLTGFPANQQASAVIHLDTASVDADCTHEVEIHMRWSDSAHDAHGYECNLAWSGAYAQIVRWNGAQGDFTYLSSGTVPSVHDGDVIKATAIGSTITLYLNNTQLAQATWATGDPGMGFWVGGPDCGSHQAYGFTSYTAIPLE